MKRKDRALRFFLFGVLVCLTSCQSQCTAPCGVFEFHDRGILDTDDTNGWEMDVDFDFNPANCGIACECDLVCFVQIVRAIDQEDGTYLYPSTEKEERATSEGFYLDRLAGKIWGYYGRNDDGSFAGSVDVGSHTSTANLYDFPKRPDGETWRDFLWMAITVPVCIENAESDCNNHLLGYYEWGWIVDAEGTVSATFHWVSPKGFKDDFDDAVAEWNSQAPGLGKNEFPAFTRLSE